MELQLHGRNALVGGGSRGIGRAAAFELAALGANVTLAARSAEAMGKLIGELDRSQGQQHDFLAVDFRDPHDLHAKATGLISTKPVHILINNTGGPPPGPILRVEPEAFQEAFTQHLICYQTLARLVVPGMIRENFGRIINIISTSVRIPLPNLGVSNTIRAAVANWAKTLANELGGYGITVNNILPGMTDTSRLRELIDQQAHARGVAVEVVIREMEEAIPLGRFGRPEEIAAAVAFLASPAAAYVNGVHLAVDGGRTGCG
jgi:3-oxoacyl-[acyl-carrier protein] reductase